MKKLNRKGFTLIELLAVIVLLAILMVVALPYVFDALGNATGKTFKNSADAIAKYASEAYSLAIIGETDGESVKAFKAFCTDNCTTEKSYETTGGAALSASVKADEAAYDFLEMAKQDPANYSSISVTIDQNTGKVCVEIEPSSTGQFSGVDLTANSKYGKSNGCK